MKQLKLSQLLNFNLRLTSLGTWKQNVYLVKSVETSTFSEVHTLSEKMFDVNISVLLLSTALCYFVILVFIIVFWQSRTSNIKRL